MAGSAATSAADTDQRTPPHSSRRENGTNMSSYVSHHLLAVDLAERRCDSEVGEYRVHHDRLPYPQGEKLHRHGHGHAPPGERRPALCARLTPGAPHSHHLRAGQLTGPIPHSGAGRQTPPYASQLARQPNRQFRPPFGRAATANPRGHDRRSPPSRRSSRAGNPQLIHRRPN